MLVEQSTTITLLSSLFDEWVLARLRIAHIKARLALNRVEYAGVALKQNWISGEGAIGLIHEAGLTPLVFGCSS